MAQWKYFWTIPYKNIVQKIAIYPGGEIVISKCLSRIICQNCVGRWELIFNGMNT
jgi:hypothetical protein